MVMKENTSKNRFLKDLLLYFLKLSKILKFFKILWYNEVGGFMKNRSELRDIIIKVLYQVYILENTNVKYDVNTLIKEQLEIENNFVKSSINGVLKNQEKY